MGLCATKAEKYSSEIIDNASNGHNKRHIYCGQKIPSITTNSYYLSVRELISRTQPPDKPHQTVTNHKQFPNSRSDDSNKSNDSPLTKELGQNLELNQPHSLSDARFLLIDLKKHMSRTSTAVLHILNTIMTSYLITIETSQQFEVIQSNKKRRLFLFTTATYVDSHEEILSRWEKIYVLGACTKHVTKTFENIHDLIFQVAAEFDQWSEEQACKHEKLGEYSLAAQKRGTISEMYNQLMDISTGE